MTNERRTNLMALKESAKRHNGVRDIIGDMTNSILDFMETDTPYPSTGGTTVTHKTVVVE
jgi:hypothetical protein